MIINNSGYSSLYDLFKKSINSYDKEGQPIITDEMWKKHWEIQIKTTNYLSSYGDESFWKNVTLNCLDLMEHVASYVIGEFDCHNEDKLSEVWAPLIRAWYFGKVWIIKSEEVMQQEIAIAKTLNENIAEDKLLRDNPFRLFEKQGFKNGKHYFKSLLTGVENFELDPQELICLSLNDGANFRRWWKVNMEYIAGKSRIIDATKALSKTVQVIVRNDECFKNERAQIENPSVFFEIKRKAGSVGAKEQNIYQAMPIIDGQRIKDMQEIIQTMYDKECEILGFTTNSNDKKERLTVAENYKDLRQITNLQDFQLKNLKIFERRLKDKNWVKENFKIEISGLTYAQGLPDTVQAANNKEEINNPQIQIESNKDE